MIPVRKAGERGVPIEHFFQIVLSVWILIRMKYEYFHPLHGRSRRLAQVLRCLSWFLAKTQQHCSVRASCLLLQHPGNRTLSLRLAFTGSLLPNYIFPASVCGPARRSPTVPLSKLLFPMYAHTDLPGLKHWIREKSCLIFPITAAVSHAFTWVSQSFFLLGPACYNGWPEEQRLDNLWWLRAEERPWLGIYSSTGQEGTGSLFCSLHEWACNHRPCQQTRIASNTKYFVRMLQL